MGLFGKRRHDAGSAGAPERRTVAPPYKIVLARGVQEQLDAVESEAFPEVYSVVRAAISSLGSTPWPAGTKQTHGSVDGPYAIDAAGYRVTWAVASFDRTVLVETIFKPSDAGGHDD